MTARLFVIRHGPTSWNEEQRLQGRADIPLSPAGRRQVTALQLPLEFQQILWRVSPLGRALETLCMLGIEEPVGEPRLVEMDWGNWEGRKVEELRAEFGDEMQRNEDRGLDFRPPRGESPREVQERLIPLLRELGRAGGISGAVTHKGVIRALYALATDWPMLGKPPHRLDWRAAQIFGVAEDGSITLERLNVPLGESMDA